MAMATDPVCGMQVDEHRAADKVDHGEKTYYFCSRNCAAQFRSNPARYLSGRVEPMHSTHERSSDTPSELQSFFLHQADQATYTCPMHPEVRQQDPGSCPKCGMALERESPAPVQEQAEYTCPMHPEFVRDQPGTCPKCGMALEPRTVTAEETHPELADMTRRFWISAILTVPLVALAMSRMFLADQLHAWLPGRALSFVEFALATRWCSGAAGRSSCGCGNRSPIGRPTCSC